MNLEKLKVEAVISKLREMNGNISAAARALNVERGTVYNYVKRHITVKQALQQSRETMLDNAESALYRAVLNGEAWAVCFFLKTRGKKRGYVERMQMEGGRKSHPLNVRMQGMSDAELDNRIEQLESRAASAQGGEAPPPGGNGFHQPPG